MTDVYDETFAAVKALAVRRGDRVMLTRERWDHPAMPGTDVWRVWSWLDHHHYDAPTPAEVVERYAEAADGALPEAGAEGGAP